MAEFDDPEDQGKRPNFGGGTGMTPFWDLVVEVDADSLLAKLGGAPEAAGSNFVSAVPKGRKVTVAYGYEGPCVSPNPFDRVIINGGSLPGVSTAEAFPKRRLDKKKHAGSDGGNPTMHGYDPCPITIECMVWTPFQLAQLEAIVRQLWPASRKTAKYKAFDVYHPHIAFVGVTSAVIVGVRSLKAGKVNGAYTLQIHAEEFNPIGKKKKSSTSSPISAVPVVPQFSPGNEPPPAVLQSGVDYSPANAQQSLPSQDINYTAP